MKYLKIALCLVALGFVASLLPIPPMVTEAYTVLETENHRGTTEFYHDASRDIIRGASIRHIIGRNTDLGTTEEDVTDVGGTWVAPTTARIHDVVSTTTTDSGALVYTASASGGTTTTLLDNATDFTSNGTATGDLLVNDTQSFYGVIRSFTATGIVVYNFTRDAVQEMGITEFKMDADDTYRIISSTGTGASAILIEGLDSNFDYVAEIVRLRGTDTQVTTTAFTMINDMLVIHAGSSQINTGDITATAQTDSTVTAKIITNYGETQSAVYQVPRDFTAYIDSWELDLDKSQANANVDARLIVMPIGEAGQTKHVMSVLGGGTSNTHHDFLGGLRVQEYAFIKVKAIGSTTGIDVAAGFDFILERN